MAPKVPAERRRPTQDRAKATREHILDTAARLFAERGIPATSTNRIAAEARVSVGTLYRYFADRSVLVDELLDRILTQVERSFSERAFVIAGAVAHEVSAQSCTAMMAEILNVFTDVLVPNSALIKELVGGVQFYDSGLPDLEPRMRILIKVMLIQVFGPGDDADYDLMAFVIVNTGFAAVLRVSAVDIEPGYRAAAIAMTAQMIGVWVYDRHFGG
ncbi:TetR/AcrR family transcriptional regulator [Nocardia sp. NPDC127579]|uniref:TetR/AcrR family transcriptional regulator n=1 Tax=Nocardia sp. NPDC127579 TaxID=3345402 RepID=UPI003640D42E